MVTWHRLSILNNLLLCSSLGNNLHSSIHICFICLVFSGGCDRAARRLPKTSHTCAVTFKSGEDVGRSILQISSLSKRSSTPWDLCGLALSSLKSKSRPMAPRNRRTWEMIISSQWRFPVIGRLSKLWCSVRPFNMMSPQTNTPRQPQPSLSLMFVVWNRVPTSLHINWRWESLLRLNKLSSVKRTWLHSWVVQFLCTLHHCKRCRRWAAMVCSVLDDRRISHVYEGVGHSKPGYLSFPSGFRTQLLRNVSHWLVPVSFRLYDDILVLGWRCFPWSTTPHLSYSCTCPLEGIPSTWSNIFVNSNSWATIF